MLTRNLLAITTLLLVATFVVAQPATKPTIENRWADLVGSDDAKATRALLALASTPKETTAFLQENLKPVKADAKRVAQLVKQLDNANFVVRNKAMMELEYFGKYIKADVEAAMKDNPTVETKMRLGQLLEKMPTEKKKEEPKVMPKIGAGKSVSVTNNNGMITILIDGQPLDFTPTAPPPPPPGPPSGWIRAVRAVTLLEHLGTPEAQQILQSIAAGESDALPTMAARESLERLKKQ